MNKKILKIFSSNKTKNIPIWLMRQAGRYLPEYQEIRSKNKDFLEFCYDIDLATEATLQPIRRFDMDAAIIFSDILVIPDAMGIKVKFEENLGPILNSISSLEALKIAKKQKNFEKLNPIYKAISKTRNILSEDKALIGFSGGAWTLASYIIEGKLTKDFSIIKSTYYKDKKFIDVLIDELVENISEHLIKQIEHGANLVQIFDSWAGMVTEEDYENLIIKPTQKIIHNIRKKYSTPIICFPRMSGFNYEKFCNVVECNAISVDQFTSLRWIRKISKEKIIQGNLDPIVLLSDSAELIKERINKIFNHMDGENFIFNLGHGVLPKTSPDMVKCIVNYIKEKNE